MAGHHVTRHNFSRSDSLDSGFSEHKQSVRATFELLTLTLGPGITLSSNSSTNPAVPLAFPQLGRYFRQSGWTHRRLLAMP